MLLMSLLLLLLTVADTPPHGCDVPEERTGKGRLQTGHQVLFTAAPHLWRLRAD